MDAHPLDIRKVRIMETVRSRAGFMYYGPSEGWFIAYQAANCGSLMDKANLEGFRRALPEGSYRVESFGGGLRGVYVDTLLIDPSRQDAINTAEDILAGLDDYPVIDDELFSDMESDDALDSAESACVIDRANAQSAAPYIIVASDREGRGVGWATEYWPSDRAVFFGYLAYRRAVRGRHVAKHRPCYSLRSLRTVVSILSS